MNTEPQYKSDDGSAIRVFVEPSQNAHLSTEHGRPIFDVVTYVEVISPGSRGSTPTFEVEREFAPEMGRAPRQHPTYFEKYRRFIQDFRSAGTDAALAGTPITEWHEISMSLAATLKAQGVYTVEALANLPDTKLIVVGPDGRTWREKAAAYIANAKDGAVVTRLAARNQELEDDLAQANSTIAAMQARIQELENAGPDIPDTASLPDLADLGETAAAAPAKPAKVKAAADII